MGDIDYITWPNIPFANILGVCVIGTRKHGPLGLLCRLVGHPRRAHLRYGNEMVPKYSGISCSRCGLVSLWCEEPVVRRSP